LADNAKASGIVRALWRRSRVPQKLPRSDCEFWTVFEIMDDILRAFNRSLVSLKHGKIWFYICLPTILAAFVMAILAICALGI
jgi:hypothetical protein